MPISPISLNNLAIYGLRGQCTLINNFIMSKTFKFKYDTVEVTDERVTITNSIHRMSMDYLKSFVHYMINWPMLTIFIIMLLLSLYFRTLFLPLIILLTLLLWYFNKGFYTSIFYGRNELTQIYRNGPNLILRSPVHIIYVSKEDEETCKQLLELIGTKK